LVVGAGAKAAVAAAKSVIEWTGQATFHEDIDALMIYAKELITSHDVVLVKASRSIGLEAVVDQLVENLGEK
jgi:UDP-N-acetylmuramyl pentapeptide synthase